MFVFIAESVLTQLASFHADRLFSPRLSRRERRSPPIAKRIEGETLVLPSPEDFSPYTKDISNQFVPFAHSFVHQYPRWSVGIDRVEHRRFTVIIDREAIDGVQQSVENTFQQFILFEIDDELQHRVDRVTFVEEMRILQS